MNERPRRIAVVVPTARADGKNASRCIAAVRETTAHLDVDLQVVESSGPGFRFSRSINRGMRAAPDADAWVLLNDDAFMDAGWLDALADAVQARPDVGLWGAVLRYPEPERGLQFAGGHIPLTPLEFFALGLRYRAPFWALRGIREERGRRYPYMFHHYHALDRRHRLDFLTGACLLVTRALRDKIGDFDEDYKFGAEDTDYSMRALEAGFELGLATGARGVHIDHATGGSLKKEGEESVALFRARWSGDRIHALTRGRHGVYHGP